jgi:hypothetical protein
VGGQVSNFENIHPDLLSTPIPKAIIRIIGEPSALNTRPGFKFSSQTARIIKDAWVIKLGKIKTRWWKMCWPFNRIKKKDLLEKISELESKIDSYLEWNNSQYARLKGLIEVAMITCNPLPYKTIRKDWRCVEQYEELKKNGYILKGYSEDLKEEIWVKDKESDEN